MKKFPRYGLAAAGAAARSMLADLPLLRKGLGPVISPSLNGASRIANALGNGHAVRDLSGIDRCEVILACAPDTGFDRVMAMLDAAALEWKGKIPAPL